MGQTEALQGLANACSAAINAAGITNKDQVGVGLPTSEQINAILQQNNRQFQVSVWGMPGAEWAPYPPENLPIITSTPVQLEIAVVGNVVTLTGTVTTGVPIHIGLNSGAADVEYTTVNGDTLTSIMSALAAKVSASGLSGVTGTASTNTVTVAGATTIAAIISSSVTQLREVGRFNQHLRVSVWAGDDQVRSLVESAILAYVGTADLHSFLCTDGTTADCDQCVVQWSDQSTEDYGLFVSHVIFACQYPVTRAVTSTQIAAGEATITAPNGSVTTAYTFGSGG